MARITKNMIACTTTGATAGSSSSAARRCAFTLIELMVSITIMSIIGGALLFASFEATEAARRAATRTKINVLHALMIERWESYESRRVQISKQVENYLSTLPTTTPDDLRQLAKERVAMLVRSKRELIKLEMPDRWSDIIPQGITSSYLSSTDPPDEPVFIRSRTSITHAYIREFERIKSVVKSIEADIDKQKILLESNQGAECLYLLITLGTADGEGRSLFRDSDTGDTDGDGALEFLDGWGNPITFLRWPAGFDSELQARRMSGAEFSNLSQADKDKQLATLANAAANDHDPDDPYRRFSTHFRLVPLIMSAGPDENYGVQRLHGYITEVNPHKDYDGNYIGIINPEVPDDHLDNIHNHLKDVR